MQVLVTGGTGRAGQHVVRDLVAAGHHVVNLDLMQHGALPGDFCRIDLGNPGEVNDASFQFRPEGVCHLAANLSPQGHARIDVFDNNVRSAYNVMQAAGDLGVQWHCHRRRLDRPLGLVPHSLIQRLRGVARNGMALDALARSSPAALDWPPAAAFPGVMLRRLHVSGRRNDHDQQCTADTGRARCAAEQ